MNEPPASDIYKRLVSFGAVIEWPGATNTGPSAHADDECAVLLIPTIGHQFVAYRIPNPVTGRRRLLFHSTHKPGAGWDWDSMTETEAIKMLDEYQVYLDTIAKGVTSAGMPINI